MPPTQTFDVFLSHNSKDKEAVRDLAKKLTARQVKVWLDEEELVPGQPWQEALEQIIGTTQTTAVLFGSAGLGPWEEPEMRACLNEFVHRKLPVIPVLLPGASAQPELPMFLRQFTWVDLRDGITPEGLDRLVWGITGTKPTFTDADGRSRDGIGTTRSRKDTPAAAPSLRAQPLITEDRVRYAITLVGDFADNTEGQAQSLLVKLQSLAQDSSLSIVDLQLGSIQLILEGSLAGFDRLLALYRNGALSRRLGNDVTLLRRLQLVILLHGIRTRAEWQSSIRTLLEDGNITVVEPFAYGYFSSLGLWFPYLFRQRPISIVESKIRDAIDRRKLEKREVVVVAHSFGTYVLTQILDQNPDIHVQRVLFCGSIIRDSFRWDKLPNRPEQVVNEAGSRDIWPIMARSFSWGYGTTGTFGINGYGVDDRFHDLAHSDYFKEGFAERFWKPWVHDRHLERTAYEKGRRPTTPLWKSVIAWLPIQHLMVVAVLLWLAFAMWPNPNNNPTPSNPAPAPSPTDPDPKPAAMTGGDPLPEDEYPPRPPENSEPENVKGPPSFDKSGIVNKCTLMIENQTGEQVRVFRYPWKYGPEDNDRSFDYSVTPPISPSPNGNHSEEGITGGLYWVVVRKEGKQPDNRTLKWKDLGWKRECRIQIPSDFFTVPSELAEIIIQPHD